MIKAVVLGVLIILVTLVQTSLPAVHAVSGVVYSANTTLSADVICSDVTINPGVTVTTNGFNFYCTGTFNNQGTIVTGNEGLGNFHSYGGSGGGGQSQLCNAASESGYFTRARGGQGNSVNHVPTQGGSTPLAPSLSRSLILYWYMAGMSGFLAGAGGENVCGTILGGAGGLGLYVQADKIIAGTVSANGHAGSGTCSGMGLSGSGGGGALFFSYGKGGYTPGKYDVKGASGVPSCDGLSVSGAGGDGQVLTFNYGNSPFGAPPAGIVVATIPVPFATVSAPPGAVAGLAYDSGKGEVFVTNFYANSVSVISDASNTVIANIPVRLNPVGVVYDSGRGEVFVANSDSGSVSVISDASNTVVATVRTGPGPGQGPNPFGVAYDSIRGEILAITHGDTLVISDASNSLVGTVSGGFVPEEPLTVAYDSTKGEVFVASSTSNIVNVISAGAVGQDFSVSAKNTHLMVQQGEKTKATILLESKGFSGRVTLTVSISPRVDEGLATHLRSSHVTLKMNGVTRIALSIAADDDTPLGTYNVAVTATSGLLSHSVRLTVAVTSSDQEQDLRTLLQ